MIKEALQYIIGMGKAEIHREYGQVLSDKPLYLLEEPIVSPLKVHTLSGLVDYLKSNFDGGDDVIVHISSPTEVHVKTSINSDANRDYFMKAEALVPDFKFGIFHSTEKFIIKLQSCFVKNEDRDIMLKVVGNIKEEMVNNYGDDGVSQSVVAKAGIATVANVEVPNPVRLAPFRTFVEVMQPESDFIFRMQNGPECAIYEADGGGWKNDAIENIKQFLELSLKDQMESGRITIIA